MNAWGEAAWTAPDVVQDEAVEHIVTDHYGTIYGRFSTYECALMEREFVGGLGIECWVVSVTDVDIEEEPC